MIAIVLIAVMLDRPVLTLRSVTIAALLVLLFAPEAVVHPSFQMSFAATLALIAVYAHGLPLVRPGKDSSLGARAALWGVNEMVSLVLASLVAGLATSMPRFISTASRLMACSPTFSPCRSSPPG
jgi:competence protein ComEC